MTDTLQAILLVPITGHHAGDHALIERIHEFVRSGAPVADRAAAIRYLVREIYGTDGTTESFDDVALLSTYLGD